MSFQLIAALPEGLGEAMPLKPADAKQNMFLQAFVTFERGSKMFSHKPAIHLAHP